MHAEPTTPSGRASASRLAAIAGVALVVALHVLWLRRYPIIAADEGGWPLAVRGWLERGRATFDYYQAPAYHWVLGLAYHLFGATVTVGRATAAVVTLAGLAFFFGAAWRLFGDRRTALWALVLLGVDYSTVLTDRRAYIEPFQMFWMNALVFFFLGRRRRDAVGAGIATLGLLLTKANAIFILVVLIGASLLDSPPPDRVARRRAWTAVAVGTLGAVLVFAAMYAADPREFMRGWIATMHGVPAMPGNGPSDIGARIRLGFVVIDPAFGFRILRVLSAEAPIGFALGMAGAIKSLFERRATLIGWWYFVGLASILVQAVWLDNHLAVIYPPLALAAAWLLVSADRQALLARYALGIRWTWASVFLVTIVAYDLAQFAGGLASAAEPTAAAVRWLDQHAQPTDVVLAAPYVVMQRHEPERSFWELPPPYLPTPDSLRAWHVRWVAVDRKEWAGSRRFLESEGRYPRSEPAAMDSALAVCCTRVFPTGVPPGAAPVDIYATGSP